MEVVGAARGPCARSGEANMSSPSEWTPPVVEPHWTIYLPLPEPLEVLIDQLSEHHVGDGDEAGELGREANALVEASRQARKKIEQALATMPITSGVSTAEPPLTDADLAEMRRRTDAATKGPWTVDGGGYGIPVAVNARRVGLDGPEISGYENEWWRREDGEFVAHARQDMVRLLDEIDRLRNRPTPQVHVPPTTERPDGR